MGFIASETPSVYRTTASPGCISYVRASYGKPCMTPMGTPISSSPYSSTEPSACRTISGMCPAFAYVSVFVLGSSTLMMNVTKRPSTARAHMWSLISPISWATSSTWLVVDRTTDDSRLITNDAGTPLPATSPKAMTTRPSSSVKLS